MHACGSGARAAAAWAGAEAVRGRAAPAGRAAPGEGQPRPAGWEPCGPGGAQRLLFMLGLGRCAAAAIWPAGWEACGQGGAQRLRVCGPLRRSSWGVGEAGRGCRSAQAPPLGPRPGRDATPWRDGVTGHGGVLPVSAGGVRRYRAMDLPPSAMALRWPCRYRGR